MVDVVIGVLISVGERRQSAVIVFKAHHPVAEVILRDVHSRRVVLSQALFGHGDCSRTVMQALGFVQSCFGVAK